MKEVRETIVCPGCGRKFTAYRTDHRKTCSLGCARSFRGRRVQSSSIAAKTRPGTPFTAIRRSPAPVTATCIASAKRTTASLPSGWPS
jgi:hypothetical protein